MDSFADPSASAQAVRHADAAALAQALCASRADTLQLFSQYAKALHDLQIPYRQDVNPPVWELGHVGWFQEWWLARNPQRARGVAADPDAPRSAGVRRYADALYDSSRVAHLSRWTLHLPSAQETLDDLALQLETTLALLAQSDQPASAADRDDALYFYRLALLHEDMHHEAAVYMAQTLALDVDVPGCAPQRLRPERHALPVAATHYTLGEAAIPGGFVFDNEIGHARVALPDYDIDNRVVLWGDYLPFVEEQGYAALRWWSERGRAWLSRSGARMPVALRRHAGVWQRRIGSRWHVLDMDEPACHLNYFEAQAWCCWAGRSLPTEAQWEHSVCTHPQSLSWGQVWEWTASALQPYAGFIPHPYRDYCLPWMDGRPVLRGASFATQARMRHWRYRNFFEAHRQDIPAGFRSCSRAVSPESL